MKATITKTPDIKSLSRSEAVTLAKTETERFDDLLHQLSDEDWGRATDCDRWTVKHVVSHVAAMCEAMTTMREMMRQQKEGKPIAKREGLTNFDGWTEYQATRYVGLPVSALIRKYEEVVPASLATRARTTPLRLMRFPSPPHGWFSMAYLRDDILTRDTWMHRADISRTTRRDIVLTREHDGRFVENIVADLAKRWKKPFTLNLTGPAGGTYVHGQGGETFELDAVEFCRILSGRGDSSHPLYNKVPF